MSRNTPLVPIIVLILAACRSQSGLPDVSSAQYREAVSAFYVGLAALQTGEDVRAREKLTRLTELAPGEPAGWANLGVLGLRQQDFDVAFQRLEKARELAPENSRILSALGTVESKRGHLAQAIKYLRSATERDPKNFKAVYLLAQETERQGGEGNEKDAQTLDERILAAQPDNLAVMLEITRLAAKRGDAEALKQSVSRLAARSQSWPPEAKQQLGLLQTAASGASPQSAGAQVAFLRNTLVRLPEYRQSLAAVKVPFEDAGEPFERLILLPTPDSSPAAADEGLSFQSQPLAADTPKADWAGSCYVAGEGKPLAILATAKEVRIGDRLRLPFPGGPASVAPSPTGIVALDFDYDFKTDLVFAGAGGVRIYRQESDSRFVDVGSKTTLPAGVLDGAYSGVWAADVDLDGDLDILLANTDGAPTVLRNNGDGTFAVLHPFEGATRLRGFAYADFDGDGDPDAALLDADGRLRLFSNERLGQFRERGLPSDLGRVAAISIADADRDGVLDLVLMREAGDLTALSSRNEGHDWATIPLSGQQSRQPLDAGAFNGQSRLLVADLDNNGSDDFIFSTPGSTRIWLSNPNRSLLTPVTRNERVFTAADLDGTGRLDLIGISPQGDSTRLVNRGTKSYHWQMIRPRAAKATGDQRINSFGIGGEIEVRAGMLFQKSLIDSAVVHFGLGEQAQTDVARIIWPNGMAQAEFELKADQTFLAEQRLKGSCPWLFAFDGTQMSFVKDCPPWSPALGLHINAQVTAGISQVEEWFKIPGRQLAPRDGVYDLRVTCELWETYYIDRYALLVVDHPRGTEIYTDERFSIPPPPLAIFATAEPRPFARAVDDHRTDVTSIIRDLDDRYLDAGRGQYQGVTRDHYVELELGSEAPIDGQLWIIGDGFVHPTDGTVNIAMSQPANYVPPHGLSLEVPDGKGGWRVANAALGFPAGKKKSVLIDLRGVFSSDTPVPDRRLRLRTNMEVYWDRLEWAVGLPNSKFVVHQLDRPSAELLYRGFSKTSQAGDSSPEIPDYNNLSSTNQRWRDLVGYFTRYGDITELLAKTDDRIVITNAGDEIRLKFPAQPPPEDGWTRDYVLVGNGWIKDGDLNSTFSKTVLPLPYSDLREYTRPPGNLEDDPAYKNHSQDWQEFHTRYVTPDRFQRALVPK